MRTKGKAKKKIIINSIKNNRRKAKINLILLLLDLMN